MTLQQFILAQDQMMEAVRTTRDQLIRVEERLSTLPTREDLKSLLPRETYDAYHKMIVEDNQTTANGLAEARRRIDLLADRISDVERGTTREITHQRALVDDRMIGWLIAALVLIGSLIGPHIFK